MKADSWSTKARFPHDCDGCRFLEHAFGADWYYCPQAETAMGGTLLRRYGPEGHEYSSTPIAILMDPAYRWAGDGKGNWFDGWLEPRYIIGARHIPGAWRAPERCHWCGSSGGTEEINGWPHCVDCKGN